MWISQRHLELLEREIHDLKETLRIKESKHAEEVAGFRKYINELLERLLLKNNVPLLVDKDEKPPEAMIDIFADIEKEEDPYAVIGKATKLDEFAR